MTHRKLKQKARDAFFDLLEDHHWDDITLPRIAQKAEISLAELREIFDGKVDIVRYFIREIDAKVLEEFDNELAEELPRERLMDLLLSRFDCLKPYKAAISAITKAAREDLTLAAQLNRQTLLSMTWMANGADVKVGGVKGAVKVQGIALIYGRILRVWLNDDESMARTMAALDKELRRGERTMRRLERMGRMLKPFRALRRKHKGKVASGEEARI